jgi:hypothetical protein
MAVSFDTYYINAENFSDATSVFTDAAMTTVAADGTYQFNGVHRTMSSGVLGSPFFCDTCCAGCSATYIYPIPVGKNLDHTVCSNVKKFTGVAIIINFEFKGPNVGYPLGLEAEYNSQTYNGVSSNRFGYLPEIYVGNNNIVSPADLAAESPYELSGFAWQPLTSSFTPTQDSTKTIAEADYNVAINNPDKCYMLIPKTSTTDTVSAKIYSPVLQTNSVGGGCDVTIPCPAVLEQFQTSATQASRTDACSASRNETAYIMRVNSTSGSPRMFDRVFSDAAGVTPLAEGYYQISTIQGTFSNSSWMHVVGSEGEVQSVGACPSGAPFVQPEVVEVICSEMRNSIQLACTYQNQQGTQLPDQQYWFDGSGDEPAVNDVAYSDAQGTTPLPDGFYQQLRGYKVFQVDSTANMIDGEITSVTLLCQ